jgi:hypothetical protein
MCDNLNIDFNKQEKGHSSFGPFEWSKLTNFYKLYKIQERSKINEYTKPYTENASKPIPKKKKTFIYW